MKCQASWYSNLERRFQKCRVAVADDSLYCEYCQDYDSNNERNLTDINQHIANGTVTVAMIKERNRIVLWGSSNLIPIMKKIIIDGQECDTIVDVELFHGKVFDEVAKYKWYRNSNGIAVMENSNITLELMNECLSNGKNVYIEQLR